MPLIAMPRIVSGSCPARSPSSAMMSVIAAARYPIRAPKTPTDFQPIFTSFGGSPPLIPRVSSQVTVSGDRCSSSPISFSVRPRFLTPIALEASSSTLFMLRPEARILGGLLRLAGARSAQNSLRWPAQVAASSELRENVLAEVLVGDGTRIEDRVVEVAVSETRTALRPGVLPEPGDEMPPDQVGQLVRRVARVAVHLGQRPGPLHAGLAHEEVHGLVERHLAPVEVDVDHDAAGAPELIEDLSELDLRVAVESFAAHHVLAVVRPALHGLDRVGEDAHEGGVRVRAHQLEVVAGVGLVDGGVDRAGEVVLAEHLLLLRRRDQVDPLLDLLEAPRRREGREGDQVADERRRLDDLERLVRREGDEALLPEELGGVPHRLGSELPRLLRGLRVVALHEGLRLLDGGAGPDAGGDPRELELRLVDVPPAELVDLLHGEGELAKLEELPEVLLADPGDVARPREEIPAPGHVPCQRLGGLRGRLLEAPLVPVSGLLPRGGDDMEEAGKARPRLHRKLHPAPDGVHGPCPHLLQQTRELLEPCRDRVHPLARSE